MNMLIAASPLSTRGSACATRRQKNMIADGTPENQVRTPCRSQWRARTKSQPIKAGYQGPLPKCKILLQLVATAHLLRRRSLRASQRIFALPNSLVASP